MFDLHRLALVYTILHVGEMDFRLKILLTEVFSWKKSLGVNGKRQFGSIPATLTGRGVSLGEIIVTGKRLRGFTLLELMIVVVIIGVLSVVAVTSYRRYSYGARNAEAQHFLQAIRLAQMSYYEQYGQYCGSPTPAKWPLVVPTGASGATRWGPVPNGNPFFQLGLKSPNEVWFQYEVAAGGAGENGGASIKNSDRPWFWAQAHSDFNGNGQLSTFEVTSEKPEVFSESVNE